MNINMNIKGFFLFQRELNGDLWSGKIDAYEFIVFLSLLSQAEWHVDNKHFGEVAIPSTHFSTIKGLDRNKVAKAKEGLCSKNYLKKNRQGT